MGDFIGEKGCGPTHHRACDCREREFAVIKAECDAYETERDELRREVERLKCAQQEFMVETEAEIQMHLRDAVQARTQRDQLQARIGLADRLASAVEQWVRQYFEMGDDIFGPAAATRDALAAYRAVK